MQVGNEDPTWADAQSHAVFRAATGLSSTVDSKQDDDAPGLMGSVGLTLGRRIQFFNEVDSFLKSIALEIDRKHDASALSPQPSVIEAASSSEPARADSGSGGIGARGSRSDSTSDGSAFATNDAVPMEWCATGCSSCIQLRRALTGVLGLIAAFRLDCEPDMLPLASTLTDASPNASKPNRSTTDDDASLPTFLDTDAVASDLGKDAALTIISVAPADDTGGTGRFTAKRMGARGRRTSDHPSSYVTRVSHEHTYSFDKSVASYVNAVPTRHTAVAHASEDDAGMELINGYVITDTLGHGAVGVVSLAYCLEREQYVAIKAVPKQKRTARRLGRLSEARDDAARQEVMIMTKLRHKNIVSLFEVIDDPEADTMYLVMQYIDRGSIADVDARGVCSPAVEAHRLAHVARQVAAGLDYLHSHGVVHRDIKPANILVDSNGECFLSDFGTARRHGEVQGLVSNDAASTGTPLFLPPEVARELVARRQPSSGAPTPASVSLSLHSPPETAHRDEDLDDEDLGFRLGCAGDIWALGVSLYALYTGHLLFHTVESIANFTGILPEAIPDDMPALWRRFFRALLHPDPRRRPTAFEVRTLIKQIIAEDEAPDVLAMTAKPEHRECLLQSSGPPPPPPPPPSHSIVDSQPASEPSRPQLSLARRPSPELPPLHSVEAETAKEHEVAQDVQHPLGERTTSPLFDPKAWVTSSKPLPEPSTQRPSLSSGRPKPVLFDVMRASKRANSPPLVRLRHMQTDRAVATKDGEREKGDAQDTPHRRSTTTTVRSPKAPASPKIFSSPRK